MSQKRQVLYSVLILSFLFLVGVIGTVSAAEVNTVQLQLEIKLLERINELNLTNEQIDQILPMLQKIQTIFDTTHEKIEVLLERRKELLVQRKLEEAEALQMQERIIHGKAILQVKQILLDFETILTPDQGEKLGRLWFGASQQNFAVMRGKYAPPTRGNAKPKPKDKYTLDQKNRNIKLEQVEDGLPIEVIQILLDKRLARLEELEKELVTLEGSERETLEKYIVELNAEIKELHLGTLESIQGRYWPQGRSKMINEDRGLTNQSGVSYKLQAEIVRALMKVLEEVQTANK